MRNITNFVIFKVIELTPSQFNHESPTAQRAEYSKSCYELQAQHSLELPLGSNALVIVCWTMHCAGNPVDMDMRNVAHFKAQSKAWWCANHTVNEESVLGSMAVATYLAPSRCSPDTQTPISGGVASCRASSMAKTSKPKLSWSMGV